MATRTNGYLSHPSKTDRPDMATDENRSWIEFRETFAQVIEPPVSATKVQLPLESWIVRNRTVVNDAYMRSLLSRVDSSTSGRPGILKSAAIGNTRIFTVPVAEDSGPFKTRVVSRRQKSLAAEELALEELRANDRRGLIWRGIKGALGFGPRVQVTTPDERVDAAVDRIMSVRSRGDH